MLASAIAPTDKSSRLLIDAAATYCNSVKLGRALQLAKVQCRRR
jgi:hypothetical protein